MSRARRFAEERGLLRRSSMAKARQAKWRLPCASAWRAETGVVCLCVPALRDEPTKAWRVAAPKALLTTPQRYKCEMRVEALPDRDTDKNSRPWHAKMVAFRAEEYSALMIGSSNFTSAGMGIGQRRNAEANLLTIVHEELSPERPGSWKPCGRRWLRFRDPENVEWLGARPEREEEEQAPNPPVAPGFLAAIYRAGARRQVVLQLEPSQLPKEWRVCATGKDKPELLTSSAWHWGRAETPNRDWVGTRSASGEATRPVGRQ